MHFSRRLAASRRAIVLANVFLFLAVSARPAQSEPKPGNHFTVDARAPQAPPETGYLQMGGGAAAKSPTGRILAINSRYLTLDGTPWLPVMGEFHYSRYPAPFWEDEILKMKAGGVQVIATYVFWIHHEEVEGRFDWSGQRDLRRFVELCAKNGMYVWVRIGPWAHGEVRNGGLPDWLVAKSPTRVNDPVYLSYVRTFYSQIGEQLRGLLWKDGGPIIGVQIENEYANRAPNGGAAHISTLKGMAIAAGIDAPVYSVTGWDNTAYPPRIVTPVFGGYPDEPWAGTLDEMPPDTQGVYQFAPTGGNAGILQGVVARSEAVQLWRYPRFTAELGAGMQLTYHRRVLVDPDDIPPITITALGSGVTLLGYYMYHGGTNPGGRLSTLQESQATGYPNDVPLKSYDFQAPLGEFGQMNGSFRKLKVIHQFVADFGSELAAMTRVLPDIAPTAMRDTTTLRVAARTNGDRGYLFFNNYVRHYPMPEQKGVQVTLRLPSKTIEIPRIPVTVPPQSAFYWPVNLDLDGVLLTYATAQPFARLGVDGVTCYFFVPSAGIEPEFAIDSSTTSTLEAKNGKVFRRGEEIYVTEMRLSDTETICIRSRTGKNVSIFLFAPERAEKSWKVTIAGREHLLITRAEVFTDGGTLHLRSRDPSALSFSIYPDFDGPPAASSPLAVAGTDGPFHCYRASVETKKVHVRLDVLRDSAPAMPVRMGPPVAWRSGPVAMAPDDADFLRAGAWRLTVPPDALSGVNDVFLDIRYIGDVGRLYGGSRLLDDNFFNGTPWEVGLKEIAAEGPPGFLRLEILPLRKDAPIYLPKRSRPDFGGNTQLAEVFSVQAYPEYEFTLKPLRRP
jgi:hypothetical protein